VKTPVKLAIAIVLFLSSSVCYAEDAWLTLTERYKAAFDSRDYVLAEQLALQEMQLFIDKRENNSNRLVYTLLMLGEIYHIENKIAPAEENYRKAYEMSKTQGSIPATSRLLICSHLGNILVDDSKFDEAETMLRSCVNKTPPPSFDKDDFVARSAFINALQRKGKLDEAESMSRDTLQWVQKTLPPDSTETADSLNMLSMP
jgi:tetratricopeptide (TPR) repeat protein